MSGRRLRSDNFRDEANQLANEAMDLVRQLKGPTKRQFDKDVNMARIRNQTETLKKLITKLRELVDQSSSNIAAD